MVPSRRFEAHGEEGIDRDQRGRGGCRQREPSQDRQPPPGRRLSVHGCAGTEHHGGSIIGRTAEEAPAGGRSGPPPSARRPRRAKTREGPGCRRTASGHISSRPRTSPRRKPSPPITTTMNASTMICDVHARHDALDRRDERAGEARAGTSSRRTFPWYRSCPRSRRSAPTISPGQGRRPQPGARPALRAEDRATPRRRSPGQSR